MTDEKDIPILVRFNPLKHQRNYILYLLKSASHEFVINTLDAICNNYIDTYLGSMTPEAIGNKVISFLKLNKAISKDDFIHWIGTKNGYRRIILNDRSEWMSAKAMS